jgi:TolB-like protein
MTQLDVMYRYGAAPTEAAMMALGRIREVYGIRKMEFSEAAKTVRLEYDATRLTEPIVHQLLRRSGLDVVERVSLIPPQPAPEPVVAPAAS